MIASPRPSDPTPEAVAVRLPAGRPVRRVAAGAGSTAVAVRGGTVFVFAADGTPRTATRVRAGRPRNGLVTLRVVGVDRAPDGVVASGIGRFDVLRSVDGRAPRRIARQATRTVRVRVRRGVRYAFWAVATDRAGNREVRARRPDARVAY